MLSHILLEESEIQPPMSNAVPEGIEVLRISWIAGFWSSKAQVVKWQRNHVELASFSACTLNDSTNLTNPPHSTDITGMNSKQKKELSKRIKFVTGQLAAIEKMLDQGREPSDIYVQLRSVESAFHKSIVNTFETEHRLELAERIVDELQSCPGSCQYCDLVEALKRDFPKLTLTQVLEGLHQIKKRRK